MQPDPNGQTILEAANGGPSDSPDQGVSIPVNVLSGMPQEISLEESKADTTASPNAPLSNSAIVNPFATIPTIQPPGPEATVASHSLMRRLLPKGKLPRMALTGLLSVIILVAAATFVTRQAPNSPKSTASHKASGALSSIAVAPMDTSDEALKINRDTTIGAKKSFTALGIVRFQSVFDSPTAFVIQNSYGSDLFTADTQHNKISVNGDIVASGNLELDNGNTSLSATGLKINGVVVCTAAGCSPTKPSSGNGSGNGSGQKQPLACASGICVSLQIKPGPADNGNIDITGTITASSFVGDGAGLTDVNALTLQGQDASYYTNADNITSGTIADGRLSTNVAKLNNDQTFTGDNKFQNALDSSNAFVIQDAAGNNLLTADTLNKTIGFGTPGQLTGALVFYGSATGHNITFRSIDGPTLDQTIFLPDATGTVCLTSGNCVGLAGGYGDVVQGGNTFGNDMILGTLDNYGFNFKTNNIVVESLSKTGAVLFKNAVDSSAAFQIQNNAGNSSLFVANTQDNRIGIANATPTSTLSINGSGLIRQGSTTSLTVSGNEITDATRSVDIQGDGRAAPDSSYGIWEGTTNLISNGGFEGNTTGWATWYASVSSLSRDITTSKFGAASMKLVSSGTCSSGCNPAIDVGVFTPFTPIVNTQYSFSTWINPQNSGTYELVAIDGASHYYIYGSSVAVTSGTWARLTATGTIPSSNSGNVVFKIEKVSGSWVNGEYVNLDGAQIEQKTVATPYVETNGATATRNAASVQAPAGYLNETQGWVAMRVRMNYSSSNIPATGTGFWEWYDNQTTRLGAYLNNTGNISFYRQNNGGPSVGYSGASWSAGDIKTFIFAWDASTIKDSVDGGAFQSVSNTAIPNLAAATFDIGNEPAVTGNRLDSDILWTATGTGALTNTDATNIYAFGNTDPTLNNFAGTADPTMVWQANNANYLTSNNQQAFTVQNSSGSNIFNVDANNSQSSVTANSLNAFLIQNVSGTSNLFNADTLNTRIGIGTNSPLTTLQVNGTGLIRGSSSSPNYLTVSGNEITDVARSQDYQGDGRTSPDSSYGIWESTTNLLANGTSNNTTGFSNNDGYATISRDPTVPIFGIASIKVTTVPGISGIRTSSNLVPYPTITSGQPYTASVWAIIPNGTSATLHVTNPSNGFADYTAPTIVGTGSLTRYTATFTAATTGTASVMVTGLSSSPSFTFWVGAWQLEQKSIATPYVETDTVTSTRSAAAVQAPSSLLSASQGWVALSYRAGYPSSWYNGQAYIRLFDWSSNYNTDIYITKHDGSGYFDINRQSSGVGAAVSSTATTWSTGDEVTVVAYWTPTTLGISVNGSPFTTGVNTTSLSGLNSTFDIGNSRFSSTGQLNGDIFWFASGAGTLTNADAASIYSFGNTDPYITNFSRDSYPTMVWSADNSTYETPSSLALQIQSNNGANLLNVNSAKGTLVANTTSKFQNGTDSTNAFQIQNAGGTSNLLVADTANTRLGIGTATPVSTVNINGSTFLQQGTSTQLTTSGNEITDATRTTNTQGDGQASPDSSYGIWEGTTNLVTYGGFEGGAPTTNNWGNNQGTFTRDTSTAKFGAAAGKFVSSGGSASGPYFGNSTKIPVTAGLTYTESGWITAASTLSAQVRPIIAWYDSNGSLLSNSFGSYFTVSVGSWSRFTLSSTAPANTAAAVIFAPQGNLSNGDTFWIDGVQLEQKAYATPYVETNGATASRSAARVQVSSTGLNATQGWIAIRTRVGFASSLMGSSNNFFPTFFDWHSLSETTPNNLQQIRIAGNSGAIQAIRWSGGVTPAALNVPVSFNAGDLLTITMTWTANSLAMSINGASFTSQTNSNIPVGLSSLFDVGTENGVSGTRESNSSILWAAAGTGTLTNTDAANLNGFGNSDPNFNQLPAGGTPTFLWHANTANYQTSSNQNIVFAANNNQGANLLSLDATNSKLTVNTQGLFQNTTNSNNAFTINNASGTQLFNVNTNNLQVTTANLQTSGAVNLTNANGTVSLAPTLNSTNTLTTSGNEITDAGWRTEGASATNIAGHSYDGKTNDSSYGIWESTTNLVANGGFESNGTSWNAGISAAGAVVSRDTTISKFGSASGKVTAGSNGQLDIETTAYTNVSPNVSYTASGWVYATGATVGQTIYVIMEPGGGASGYNIIAYQGTVLVPGWQRVTATASTTKTDATRMNIYFRLASAVTGQSVNVDGVQLEQKAFATPYVETNGATATRNPAVVQVPAREINAKQGWVSLRVRYGISSSTPRTAPMTFFDWGDDVNNRIRIYMDTNDTWTIQRIASGMGVTQSSSTQTFAAGDVATVVAYYSSSSIGISVNGSAFSISANSYIPAISTSNFNIGQNISNVYQADSDIFWTAAGTGALANTDAATLNSLGNTDPTLAKLYSLNSGAGNPTFVWNANAANYQDTTSSNGQALIYAANTTGATTGNLLDLQSGSFPSSKFSVDVSGNTTIKGSVLAQNTTDSTTAFQIQNAAGTSNLFVADTQNSRVGIGTAAPTATLAVNGTGLFQAPVIGSSNSLTVSGNEITDAIRATNTQGDGKTPPDSSYGIWEGTTNLVTNGGFESNTTGWSLGCGVSGATVSRDTTKSKFGNASLKIITDGTVGNQGVCTSNIAATAGSTYTFSTWIYATSSTPLLFQWDWVDSGNAVLSTVGYSFTATPGWNRYSVTSTAPTNTAYFAPRIRTQTTPLATTFWLDGIQAEQKAVATPYVETNGAAATRGTARVQAPNISVSGTQGWVAMRVRYGRALVTSGSPGEGAFLIGDQTNGMLGYFAGGASGNWNLYSNITGTTSLDTASITAGTPSSGDLATVIFAWDSNYNYVSLNGSALSLHKTARSHGAPNITSTNFDIGSLAQYLSNSQFDGDILWFASGNGSLTDTDATNINTFGNTDPNLNSFSALSNSNFVWQANNATYQSTNFQPIVFQVQNSSGNQLLGVDANASALLLPNATSSTAALILGNDANLYRFTTNTLKTDSSFVAAGGLTVNGSAAFQNSANSTSAFKIQDSTGSNTLFNADTTNNQIALGAGSNATTLVLGVKSSSGDPANPTNGEMYYNSTMNAFRCYQAGVWVNCTGGSGGSGGGDINQGGNAFGANLVLGTNDNFAFNLRTNGNNVVTLGTNGSALFQNSTDSTSAFSIQNAAGNSNLFVADTADSRIGVGTATPVSTLNVTGSTFLQQGSGTSLTASGSEITDATRTTNTQGDGRTSPDSSYGIWESTTNLVTNGGFESNSTGWQGTNSSTVSRSVSNAKFGAASLQTVTPGGITGEGAWDNPSTSTVSANTVYTASLWFKAPAGSILQMVIDEKNAGTHLTYDYASNVTATGSWQRATLTFTTSSTTNQAGIGITTSSSAQAITFYIDGAQLEQKTVATPYVETNGATASRSAARVQAPVGNMNATQGWFAARVRVDGLPSTFSSHFPTILSLDNDTTHRMTLRYDGSTWSMFNFNGTFESAGTTLATNTGDFVTVAGTWTSTTLAVSVNGGSFASAARNLGIPAGMTTIDVGNFLNTFQMDGEILWATGGTGTLTNTDAAALNGFGNSDPSFNQLPAAGTPTFLWHANSANYQTSSNQNIVFAANNNAGNSLLSLDATNSKLTVNTAGLFQNNTNSSNAFTVNNASGTQLFNVNTSNLQVTTANLQSSGAVNLTNANGTVALAPTLNSTSALTVSGNEITDSTRTTNTQGDGRTPPDSSYGLWESTTNLVTNGGFESNLTGWSTVTASTTLARDTTNSKFGTASLQVNIPATTSGYEGARAPKNISVTSGTTYTISAWIKAPAGQSFRIGLYSDINGTLIAPVSFTGTGGWQRYLVTGTAAATDTSAYPFFDTTRTTGSTAFTMWVDGVQVEQKTYATPYVETNGATAIRGSARIQAPARNINATQGWFATTVRMAYASGSMPSTSLRLFDWENDGNNRLTLVLNPNSGNIQMTRWNAGVATVANFGTSWSQGAVLSVVATWTANSVGLSVNGAPFVIGAGGNIPSLTASNFDIGQVAGTSQIDGDILWTASGTGTLTNADAATLNSLGNTDPTLAKLYTLNSGAGNPTFVWNANNANYQDTTSSNGQSLIYAANTSSSPTGNLIDLQSGNYPSSRFSIDTNGNTTINTAVNSATAFQVQNSSGNDVLAVDTANTRVGIGTSAPMATLAVNGTGLIQASSAISPTLTASGNEITDATRTINTQGDGRTPPDSSYGIWEGTTNLVTNGGFESNLNSWSKADSNSSVTWTRDTTVHKFGTSSSKLVNSEAGANDWVVTNNISVSPSTTYTASAWVNIPTFTAGANGNQEMVVVNQVPSVLGYVYATAATNGWVRLTTTFTTGASDSTVGIRIYVPQGTEYIDGVQLEQKSIATPYAETNGATATRNAAGITAPASALNATQGWVAMRVRLGIPLGSTRMRFFEAGDDSNNRITGLWSSSSIMTYRVGGGTVSSVTTAATGNSGDYKTLIFSWDSGHVYLSINGSTFASATSSAIPSGLGQFSIGANLFSDAYADSDVLWTATGTGTLSNSDATNINNFGNTDPGFSSFPGAATTTMVWGANNTSYANSTTTSPLTFDVQNSSGSSLLSVNGSTGAVNLQNATTAASGLTFGGDANLYRGAAGTLRTDSNLTVAGSGLFQNAVDSTTAFQIQNSAGNSNLLVADTLNTRVGIGTSSATSTLSVNGSGLFQQNTATTLLTTSGNEITDATRQSNTQGDGRSYPDSSYGIWESTTNLILNGGAESNMSNVGSANSAAVTRVTSTSKFGSASVQVVTPGSVSNEGVSFNTNTGLAAPAGTSYTGSVWVKGSGTVSVWTRINNTDTTLTESSVATVTLTSAWQRVIAPVNTVATGKIGDNVTLFVRTNAIEGITFYADGAQIEQKSIATPYVETNGATATRNAAGVHAPGSLVNPTTGWIALRARLNYGSTDAGGSSFPTMFRWQVDANNRLIAYYYPTDQKFHLTRSSGGSNTGVGSAAQTFSSGALFTLIFMWDSGNIYLSVNGGAFVSTANTLIPAGTASVLDIGNGDNPSNSDILWSATGTGSLTGSDATNIYNFGNTDPSLASFPVASNPTMAWNANTATYNNSSSQALVLSVQNSSGTGLLNVDANSNSLTSATSAKFQNATNSTTAFQVQNASGQNVLAVDTTNGQLDLGTPGASGVNGSIVLNSATANGYTVSLSATSNLTQSYALKLPNTAPVQGQCLVVDSVDASQLNFGSCATGSGGAVDLQGAYNNSTTPATITTTSATKGVLVKAGTGYDQTSLFQIQDSSSNPVLSVDSTNDRVGINNATPQSALDVNAANAGIIARFGSTGNGINRVFINSNNNNSAVSFGVGGVSQWGIGALGGGNFVVSTSGDIQTGQVLTLNKANGAATFKNNTDSTSGFSIQNAAGNSNLFVADTADSRIGIGTATPVATANVVGSTLLQQGSSTSLTVSGNEITDATRTTNTQGDGQAAPSSSYGIWEGTTNLVTNGGFESNTTGWTYTGTSVSTLSRDTSVSEFGAASMKVQTPGSIAGEGATLAQASSPAAASGQKWTASAWVKGSGTLSLILQGIDGSGTQTESFTSSITLSNTWQRVTASGTLANAGTTNIRPRFQTSTAQALSFWLDGVQLEQKSIATPYVETNGATASRSVANTSAPSSLISGTQGWVAARIQPEWSSAAPNTYQYVFHAYSGSVSGGPFVDGFYDKGTSTWSIQRNDGTTPATARTSAQTFSAGSTHTVIFAWTSTTISVSIDGGAFTTLSASNVVAPTNFTIGNYGTSYFLDGEMSWAAAGTGTLTNADATNLNGFGNSDPNFNQLPAGGAPTFLWKANNANYNTSSNSDIAFQVNNNSGSSLLSLDATNSKLTLNTAGLIQTNSTNALAVNSSSGTNLFNVNTSNLQVSANNLQSSGAVNLTNSNGTVSLAGSLQSTNSLTTSGNEITDATRTTNTQGDGKTPPDSSYGIWEGTMNLVTNGGAESNGNGWGANQAGEGAGRDTGWAKFGTASVKWSNSSYNGTTNQILSSSIGVTGGNTYTASGWFNPGNRVGTNFVIGIDWRDSSNNSLGITYSSGTALNSVARLTVTGTAPANTVGAVLRLGFSASSSPGDYFYVDGIQLEQKSIATPYVETNGATATRNAGLVQAPASNITASQGWVAVRLRMGFASTAALSGNAFVFSWDDGTNNNKIQLFWSPSYSRWETRKTVGGVSGNPSVVSDTFNAGDTRTLILAWTPTSVGISVAGSSFNSLINSNLPTGLLSQFTIGSTDISGNLPIDSDVLWTAAGTGTLTNTDATTLSNFGNTDPTLAKIYALNSGAGQPTFVWNANNANYQDATSSNGQALIYAANTSSTPSGNLLDLQSGANPTSKFFVDVKGNTTVAGQLTVNNKGLFQNSSDSTSAFQILNAAGSALLTADTTNGRLGVGTSAPTATLGVNGSAIIQQSSAAGPTVTVSGNEITDSIRTTNTQGDGQAVPDSSYGIWEGATNLNPNGGAESNVNYTIQSALPVSRSITRSTSFAKFGSASFDLTTTSELNDGYFWWHGTTSSTELGSGNGIPVTGGQTYTLSAWVKIPSALTSSTNNALVKLRIIEGDNAGNTISDDQSPSVANLISTYGQTFDWVHVNYTITTQPSTTNVSLRVNINHAVGSVYVDGIQFEQKSITTPYVETNGVTATRNAARVQASSSLLDSSRGWVAFRVRMGWASNNAPNNYPFIFDWRTDGNNRVGLTFNKASSIFQFSYIAGGVEKDALSSSVSFNSGDYVTLVGYWDTGAMTDAVSVNGAGFSTASLTSTMTPTGASFDIGDAAGANYFDSDVLWAAAGNGTLTNTDVSNINGFGNSDPSLSSFNGNSGATMVWAANDAKILTPSNQPIVFQVQDSLGNSLLNADANAMAINVGGALNVSGVATLNGALNLNGAATLSSTLTLSGPATLQSTLSVTGNTTLQSGLTLAGNLTANGSANFQNTTDSTNAFNIQTSGGTSLFSANTSNLQVSAKDLQVGGSVNLTGANGTVSLAPQINSPNSLTASGNEITDTSRTANTQGDGRAAPDSSYGIWEATTNLITNGGAESNTNNTIGTGGGTTTITQDASTSKFGAASFKVVTAGDSNSQGIKWGDSPYYESSVSPSTTYTASAWVKGTTGTEALTIGINWYDSSRALISGNQVNFTASTTFTREIITATSPSNAAYAFVRVAAQSTSAYTFWADGAQLEQKSIATPYVETNGAVATRNPASITGPASSLNAAQGWFATRVRMGFASSSIPASASMLVSWVKSTTTDRIYLDVSATGWHMNYVKGNVNERASMPASFNAGDLVTVVGYWTSNSVGISVNGSAFTTASRTQGDLTGLPSTFNIGNQSAQSTFLDGDQLWLATGTGTLTNTDATTLNNYGNTDPTLAQLLNLGASVAKPTFVWKANTAVYQDVTDSNGQSLIYVANTSSAPYGNLIDLQSGTTPSSKFTVDTSGNTIVAGNLTANSSVLFQNSSDNVNAFQVQTAGGATLFNIDTTGSGTITLGGSLVANGTALFQPAVDSPTAFQIQSSSGSGSHLLLVGDTTNMRLYVGNPAGSTTGALLVLSNKTTAGDPTGTNGAMYYNSSLGKFRCYENGTWENCNYGAQTTVKSGSQSFSGTSYSDVTDMGYAVGANKNYTLQCTLLISVSGGGGNISMNGPASPSSYTSTFMKASDQSAGDQFVTSNTYDDPNISSAFLISTTTTGSNKFILNYSAVLSNGPNAGTWQLRAKAASGGSITFYPVSSCDLRPF